MSIVDETVDRLSSYAASLEYEDIPNEVVNQTKRLIVDSIGCGLGATTSDLAGYLLKVASCYSSKPVSTILGTTMKTTPDLAAFVNGTMVRYLDFNDSYGGKEVGHPSDNIPAVMAVAEASGASGRDLITGIVIAYEVQTVWIDSFRLRDKGPWDQAVYATISMPLGAGKVMGLTKDQLADALRISVVQGLSFMEARRGHISHWKACAVPNAGRNGVFAAMLAKHGVNGPPAIFEGTFGFFAGATREPVILEPLAGEKGSSRPFRIMDSRIKRFPSGFFSQTAIEGALEAKEALGIEDSSKVKKIKLKTFRVAVDAMAGDETRWHPKTRETADHSLPYVIACALNFGSVEVSHFDEEMLSNPVLIDLMAKTEVEFSPECEAMWPDATLNVLSVETMNGRQHTASVPYHLGHPKRPMSDDALENKFRRLCHNILTEKEQDAALEAIWHIEKRDELSDLFQSFLIHA
jgi:2-methylcitrate dehydratase